MTLFPVTLASATEWKVIGPIGQRDHATGGLAFSSLPVFVAKIESVAKPVVGELSTSLPPHRMGCKVVVSLLCPVRPLRCYRHCTQVSTCTSTCFCLCDSPVALFPSLPTLLSFGSPFQ